MYLSLPIPTTNQRLFDVVFFPLQGLPVRYGVRVHKLGQLKDVAEGLAKLVGLTANEIALADIYSNRAFLVQTWIYLFDVRKSDVIYG